MDMMIVGAKYHSFIPLQIKGAVDFQQNFIIFFFNLLSLE